MVLEADRLGCLTEVLVIAAALSIQDPRERPVDAQERAAAAARPVRRPALGLPRPTSTCGATCGSSRRPCPPAHFRRMCRAEMLHYLRVREWQDLVSQLRRVAKDLGLSAPSRTPAGRDRRRPGAPGAAGRAALARGPARRRTARLPRGPRARASRSGPARPWPGDRRRWVDGGRAGRDVTAVGPHRRARSSRRGSSRWPAHLVVAHLQRAALVGPPRRGHGLRAGHALRPAAGHRTPGRLRRHRPGGRRRAVHPARAGAGRLDAASRLRPGNALAVERDRGAGGPQRGVAICSPTRRTGSTSSTPRIPATIVSQRHFDRWWRTARRATPDLLTLDDAALRRGGGALATADAFRRPGRYGDVQLPIDVRSSSPAVGRRRRERARAGDVLPPARSASVQLAGARAARGAGTALDPLAPQGDPPQLRPRPDVRRRRAPAVTRPTSGADLRTALGTAPDRDRRAAGLPIRLGRSPDPRPSAAAFRRPRRRPPDGPVLGAGEDLLALQRHSRRGPKRRSPRPSPTRARRCAGTG